MTLFSRESSSTFTNKTGCLVLFGLFWTGFSSIFLIIGLTQGEFVFALVGGLFVLIGLALMAWGLLSVYTRMRVGKPEINISKTLLRVGESFSFTYSHSFRSAVQVDKILVNLIFRETATYQRGTDTRTVTHEDIIDEYEEPGGQFQSGTMIGKSYALKIPDSAMHTLEVRRNKLQWFLKFEMDIPRLPDFVEEVELEVIPELVGR